MKKQLTVILLSALLFGGIILLTAGKIRRDTI